MTTRPQHPSPCTVIAAAAALLLAALAVVVLEAATRRWPVPARGGAA